MNDLNSTKKNSQAIPNIVKGFISQFVAQVIRIPFGRRPTFFTL